MSSKIYNGQMEDGDNRSDKDLVAEEEAPSSTSIERAIGIEIEDEISDADKANISADKASTPKTIFVDFYLSIVIIIYFYMSIVGILFLSTVIIMMVLVKNVKID